MTATVQFVLDSFDSLSAVEQHEVIVELLRRAGYATLPDLPEQVLLASADSLFRELDEQEATDARTQAR
jgi:hypothetical protein